MAQILALLLELSSGCRELLTNVKLLVSLMKGVSYTLAHLSQEHQQYATETMVANLVTHQIDRDTGLQIWWDTVIAQQLAAIFAVRLDTTTPHAATVTDVLDAVGALPVPVGNTTPPDWYTTPPDVGGIPEAVWGYHLPHANVEAYTALDTAYFAGAALGHDVVPLATDPRFGLWAITLPSEAVRAVVSPLTPLPDWTGALDTDTQLSWLQRTDTSGLAWEDTMGTGRPYAPLYDAGEVVTGYVVSLLTDLDFYALTPMGQTGPPWWIPPPNILHVTPDWYVAPTPGGAGAPVWPGIANVTLGTPVDLVDQLVLDGPMDGCVVNVTTPPTRTGLRRIGGAYMDYGVGEMSFQNDDGWIEPWVYLGFRQAIFTPKTMQSAAHALFRVLAGAGGTVTPWTRTAP